MKNKIFKVLLVFSIPFLVSSCNYQIQSTIKNKENKEQEKNSKIKLKTKVDNSINKSENKEKEKTSKVDFTSNNINIENKKDDKNLETKKVANENNEVKNNEQKQDKKTEENSDTSKVKKNSSNEESYFQLKSEVTSFIETSLEELKYKKYKDELENIINDTYYFVMTKQYKNLNEFYGKQKEILSSAFEKVIKSYTSAEEVKDFNTEEKNTNTSNVVKDYNKTLDENILINEESRYFMNLFSVEKINDYYKHKEQQNAKKFILEKTLEITSGKSTRMSKIRAIYDWIHKNLRYAHNGDITAEIDPVRAYKNKFAVCGGYSNLYKAMLDSIGVKNVVVIGWSRYGDHQWNLVYDEEGKNFFHSDPTWGGDANFNSPVENFSRLHRTYKIIDAHQPIGGFEYEYNRGFSVFKNLNNKDESIKKPLEIIDEKYKVVSISQETLQTSDVLYIGENIERIDYLGGTYNVKRFEVHPNNKYFSSKNGVLFSKDMKILLVVPRKYENTEITIPKTVKVIEDLKSSLQAEKLNKILVEPGNYWYKSFGGILYNSDFTNIVYVPNNINKTLIVHPFTKLKQNDFSFNKNIEEIIIPEGIEKIPRDFLNNLTSFKKIYLPSTLKSFDENAFSRVNSKDFEVILADKISEDVIKTIEKLKYKIKNK
ncbi:transglutaminase-like domain-containing protein [Mesomycoplasma molare]|uniref:Transglutaminase-like domain-containing protein n=1 Tax=Mesomycoplasma molare TaxID=171288 RepID=A0ABY5TV30_9BACT|nr:transglutaminase-like domain-containing protein [Mesomycoplasma molare]UWD34105.1 transglutaminase-like domain-containing protein [Mesomycoplasma molare]